MLFPHGELGWSSNFPRRNAPYTTHTTHEDADEEEEPGEDVQRGRNNSTRVSQQQWWKYFLQLRTPLPPQLLAGRLFHELVVDAFALPPHKLCLKPGCPVMLLRNLDPGNRLCNGTRLIIQSASRKLLRCSILGTRRHGEIVQLPRIPLDTPSVDAGLSLRVSNSQ